mmetsp:Transcript_13194/g.36346  ORF Transcript_13194/g.36346 Transcript_13194/m.36346 type:complete len:92 (+) Transcript_13194:1635-1910(+)
MTVCRYVVPLVRIFGAVCRLWAVECCLLFLASRVGCTVADMSLCVRRRFADWITASIFYVVARGREEIPLLSQRSLGQPCESVTWRTKMRN